MSYVLHKTQCSYEKAQSYLIYTLYSSPVSACPDMSRKDKELGQDFLEDNNDRPDTAKLGHPSDQAGTSNLPKKAQGQGAKAEKM